MIRAPECKVTCQYAADVQMLPEHECRYECQYLTREPYPGQAPCPHCFESSGFAERIHPATWDDPSWSDSDPTRPCPYCNATGTVECELVTLDDLDDLDADEAAA